jgi:DNA-binding NarL/FixJ family response regulator
MVAVLELEPDLLITDISMPILNGLQVANGLRNTRCRTKIIFVTMHRDPDMIMAAQAAGVSGYVVKTLVASDLIPAVKEVMRGTFVSY